MKNKHVILAIIGGGVLIFGFGGFVLLLSFLQVVGDDVERAEAGKLTITGRHKMLYYGGDLPPTIQCVEPEIGVCETPVKWNRENHRAGGSRCRIKGNAPQPFVSRPQTSDIAEYEFDLEPGKTYYWYAFLGSYEDCIGWLPAEYEGFATGEIKLEANEIRRVEFDFTK